MLEPTISGQLGASLARLSFRDLSQSQVSKLKIYFLDWLGSAIAGTNEAPVQIILSVIRDLGALRSPRSSPVSPMATAFGGAGKRGFSHVVEMDDLHRESILHPAAAIIPAVFALAEREKASGQTCCWPFAVGYEAAIRVALSVGPSHYRFWHTTATCGTFGAAAGAGQAARIGRGADDRCLRVGGDAGRRSMGVLTNNAMSKQLHTGKAALNGLLSALLAQRGFTGARKILEGEKGFFKATSSDFDGAKCLANLGKEFYFERNSIKYHASCGHTHSAIDAVLQATQGPASRRQTWKRQRLSLPGQPGPAGDIETTTPYLANSTCHFVWPRH